MTILPTAPDPAQVYTDFSGLAALRRRAREDQGAALDQVARQFESLFLQMMLKSMRAASFGGGLLDSKQSEFFRDMYDQQLAVDLSQQQGIGLADVLKRQLGGDRLAAQTGLQIDAYQGRPVISVMPLQPPVDAVSAGTPASTEAEVGEATRIGSPGFDGSPRDFIDTLWPSAQKAAAELDLAPEALIAQAALETGWGRHMMRHADGSNSHNLFGIKTGRYWDGEQVTRNTLEYKDGVALKTRADFRAYDSFQDSFEDYVGFVRDNPRYAAALQAAGDSRAYFAELQKAGYATDPGYADKIGRILDSDEMREARSRLEGVNAG